jgi:hypothetical protein
MKSDETLIQLRDNMTERDILDVLRNVSKVQHRLLEISLQGGSKAHLAYMGVLFQAAGATEMAILNLEQASQQKSGLLRPQ